MQEGRRCCGEAAVPLQPEGVHGAAGIPCSLGARWPRGEQAGWSWLLAALGEEPPQGQVYWQYLGPHGGKLEQCAPEDLHPMERTCTGGGLFHVVGAHAGAREEHEEEGPALYVRTNSKSQLPKLLCHSQEEVKNLGMKFSSERTERWDKDAFNLCFYFSLSRSL